MKGGQISVMNLATEALYTGPKLKLMYLQVHFRFLHSPSVFQKLGFFVFAIEFSLPSGPKSERWSSTTVSGAKMPISYSSGSSSGNSWLDPEFQEMADHVDNETIDMWHPSVEVRESRSIAKKWREKNNILLEDIMYLQTRVKALQGMNNTLGAEVSDLSNINKELSLELQHARAASESFAKTAVNSGKTSHILLIYGLAVSFALLVTKMFHA